MCIDTIKGGYIYEGGLKSSKADYDAMMFFVGLHDEESMYTKKETISGTISGNSCSFSKSM